MFAQHKWLIAIALALIITFLVNRSKVKLMPLVANFVLPIALALIIVIIIDAAGMEEGYYTLNSADYQKIPGSENTQDFFAFATQGWTPLDKQEMYDAHGDPLFTRRDLAQVMKGTYPASLTEHLENKKKERFAPLSRNEYESVYEQKDYLEDEDKIPNKTKGDHTTIFQDQMMQVIEDAKERFVNVPMRDGGARSLLGGSLSLQGAPIS